MLKKNQEDWSRLWRAPSKREIPLTAKLKRTKIEEENRKSTDEDINLSPDPACFRDTRLEVLKEKNALRYEVLKKRSNLPPDKAGSSSSTVADCMASLAVFKRARSVALYSPILNEVGTEYIFLAAKRAGIEIFFPRVEGQFLGFFKVFDLNELKPGPFGTLEPQEDAKQLGVNLIDLIVIPAVAFDRSGARLGFGKGYYDRALAGVSMEKRAGLAYSFQILDRVPVEDGDERVGFIVTELGTIFCQGGY